MASESRSATVAPEQVCAENGVPPTHFNAFHLLLYLRVKGGYINATRRIQQVHASDGRSPHGLVFDAQQGLDTHTRPADGAWEDACREFLQRHYDAGVRTIEDTRSAFLAFSGATR